MSTGPQVLNSSLPAPGRQDPSRFAEGGRPVREEHDAKLADHEVELPVRERQIQCVGLLPGRLRRPARPELDHRRVQIRRDHLGRRNGRDQFAGQHARSGGKFQHAAWGEAGGPLSEVNGEWTEHSGCEPSLIRLRHLADPEAVFLTGHGTSVCPPLAPGSSRENTVMTSQQRFTHITRPEGVAPGRGYTQVVTGTGQLVAVSGQVAVDEEGYLVGPGDPPAQARQVFENLRRCLAAAGLSFSEVIKLTFYLTDMAHLPVVRTVRDEFIDTTHPPASTAVQVVALARPEFLLEVEAFGLADTS